MPNRVKWDLRFGVGNASLDVQHKHFIDQCNALADCLDTEDEAGFDRIFAELMAAARTHFATEETLLADHGCSELDDHRSEQEEYEFLAAEIVTTDNFDRNELQTFLALWWVGHILGAARNHRACLEGNSVTS
jgi:hemerythrin-like metal-binding protein